MKTFSDKLRDENIEDEVLCFRERLIFDSMSLHNYKEHRAKRSLPPLTKWQEEALSAERIADMVFATKEDRKRKNPQTFKPTICPEIKRQ